MLQENEDRKMYNYLPIFSLEKQRKVNGTMCFGSWDIIKKNVMLYLRSIKWSAGGYDNGFTHTMMCNKIADTIKHEVLHGVIQHQLQKDKYSGTFNPEWPMLNGFDKDYKRVMNRMMKKK